MAVGRSEVGVGGGGVGGWQGEGGGRAADYNDRKKNLG